MVCCIWGSGRTPICSIMSFTQSLRAFRQPEPFGSGRVLVEVAPRKMACNVLKKSTLLFLQSTLSFCQSKPNPPQVGMGFCWFWDPKSFPTWDQNHWSWLRDRFLCILVAILNNTWYTINRNWMNSCVLIQHHLETAEWPKMKDQQMFCKKEASEKKQQGS